MTHKEIIQIDGSYGEGGGQILRTSIALSALINKPVLVQNIRANRPKKGLANQHFNFIKAVQGLTDARVEGLKLGSTEVEFIPGGINPGRYVIDIGTAGSISLLLQGVMIPGAFSSGNVELSITGGTDVRWSPSIDYLKRVFLENISKMGYSARVETMQRGYYPRGGGKVRVVIRPLEGLKPIDLTERGRLKKINGISHSLNLPCHIVERQADAARKAMDGYDAKITLECRKGFSTGCGITLWAEFESSVVGASALGEPGKRAEKVGLEAGKGLLNTIDSKAPLDIYMGDQIIPYMGIADGNSEVVVSELTSHLKTNIYTTERILGNKFRVTRRGENYLIKAKGIGFSRES